MKRSSPTRSHFLAALCLVGLGAATALAQIGGLGGLSDKLTGKNPLSKLLAGKPPITTSLEDARWADASKDNFTPREAARAPHAPAHAQRRLIQSGRAQREQ